MIPLGDDVEHDDLPLGGFILIGVHLVLFLFLMKMDASHPPQRTSSPGDPVAMLMSGRGGDSFNRLIAEQEAYQASLPSNQLIEQWGLSGKTLRQGEFSRLLTHMFLYKSLWTLIGNMLVLSAVMWTLEAYMGTGRFLLLYVGAGALAALGEIMLNPDTPQTAIGGSGALAGVIGAYCLRFGSSTNIHVYVTLLFRTRRYQVPSAMFAVLWIATQWQGLAVATLFGNTCVGWFAQLAGFFAGMSLMGILGSDGKMILSDEHGTKRIVDLVAAEEEATEETEFQCTALGSDSISDRSALPPAADLPPETCGYCGLELPESALVAPTLYRCPAETCGRMHIAKSSLPVARDPSLMRRKPTPVGS